jgi:hypothetical protein
MPKLYGTSYTKEELLKRIGNVSQVGGVTLVTLADGPEAGVRAAEIRTGAGLNFVVLLDRGMDVSRAEYHGASLAWRSAAGDVHPSFYEPHGLGWLRTFEGGLVTTCGLTYLGAPCIDDGRELGLHGRISHTPARNVSSGGEWKGDDYIMYVEGEMRESVVFAENILLRRRIEANLGESRFRIHDVVRNEGFQKTPLMILYHINIGFPVVDDGSELIYDASESVARDEVARPGFDERGNFSAPISGYKEQVFFHDMNADPEGNVHTAIVNRKFDGGNGLGVYVKYRKPELNRFIEWKMMGEGTYVVGMEPANCLVQGRAKERERGTLQFIEPREVREFHLEIGVLSGENEIEQFERGVGTNK